MGTITEQMNQFLALGAAFILAGLLWGLGKKPQSLGNSFLATSPSITPRSRSYKKRSLKPFSKLFNELSENSWSPPSNLKDRLDLRKHLEKLMLLGPEERLKAIQIASNWGDKSVVSLLRRGLRDSDSEIVLISAKAMERFRSHPEDCKSDQIERPPLNVFLMR